MEKPVVKTSGLSKKYRERYVVQDINVEIRRAQIYGLIGQNGAGKTTFIRMLTGLITPTEGQIELCRWNLLHVGGRRESETGRSERTG